MNSKTITHSIAIISFLIFAPIVNAFTKQFQPLESIVYDDRFYNFIDKNSKVEVLATGLEWAEGPVWANNLNALLFSDVATDKIYRWDEAKGLSTFLHPSGHEPDGAGSAWRGSNGLAIDNSGNLILAQQSNRRLARMKASLSKPQPQYHVINNSYNGKKLNSPNDLVVHPRGGIYFTDPPYGLAGRENSPDIELGFFGVFRLSKENKITLINKDLEKPNGIALSTDYSTLFISNSENGKSQILAIKLDKQGNSIGSDLFFDGSILIPDGPGATDGMAIHSTDFLFISIPNGVGILSPNGKLLGKIALGQVTNMTFDNEFSFLYVTTPKTLLRIKINSVK